MMFMFRTSIARDAAPAAGGSPRGGPGLAPARAAACLLVCFAALTAACAGGAPRGAAAGWDDPRRAQVDARILDLIEARAWGDVIRLADSLEAAGAGDPRLWGQKALALGRTERIEEAIALFERSLRADYASCENHLNFAVVLLEDGRSGRALTELFEAERFCGPENLSLIRRNRSVARIHRGEHDLARQEVEAGLRFASGDPYLLGLKGMLVAETAPAQAESLFASAERAGGMTSDFLYHLGLLLLRAGRPAEALRPLAEALRLDPAHRGIRYAYADAMAGEGRHEEARQILSELLAEQPDEAVTKRLARLLFRGERFEEALELFRSLPQEPENRDRVAMCLHRLGRSDEALKIQRGVVAERPDWPVGLVNLAVILAAGGQLDEAELLLLRALQLDPENVSATIGLETLRRARSGEP